MYVKDAPHSYVNLTFLPEVQALSDPSVTFLSVM